MTTALEQRTNMVDSQIRPSDVTDSRIIAAMSAVPREQFVPSALRTLAYADQDLQVIARDGKRPARYLLAPRTFAKMLQAAEIDSGDIVLDVGAATGYSTAVMARIAQTVVGLEEDERHVSQATKALNTHSIDNAVVEQGSLTAGVAAEGPFDAILLEGAVDLIPDALLDQLKDGGRLVAILEEGEVGRGVVVKRSGTSFDRRVVFDATGPALPGFQRVAAFEL
ncbi:MAG: protein-L-isoaspartate O-methyltransferase [Pseudomonadota bacterium]